MLTLPGGVRLLLCREPADMRWSFDRLAALAREWTGSDPLGGSLFIFRSKRGDRLKILYWDRDGYALWYKRLEEGVFRLPVGEGRSTVVTPSQVAMILGGLEEKNMHQHKRFSRS